MAGAQAGKSGASQVERPPASRQEHSFAARVPKGWSRHCTAYMLIQELCTKLGRPSHEVAWKGGGKLTSTPTCPLLPLATTAGVVSEWR